MHSYEVEIKSLLGRKERADELKAKMKDRDPGFLLLQTSSQLNHYFVGGDLMRLYENVRDFVEHNELPKFKDIASRAKDFSVRTRQTNGEVRLVVKASLDEGTSANTVARMEFETKTEELSLEELDALLLKSGFDTQAKWSRDREEYKFLDTNVCFDRNAGYGYLAEFEIIETDEAKVPEAKKRLLSLMKDLGADELPQDRLERMFAHYNKNWRDYYGTEKVFVIE